MEHPEPDTKNWTWVLERPCPQCGYDADAIARKDLPGRIRSAAAAWRKALGRAGLVHQRPPVAPGASPVWSALEYGCHVRDVLVLFEDRLRRMQTDDEPTFTDWDQNWAAVEADYPSQDPGRVSYALAVSAGRIADMLDRVAGPRWDRVGIRSDGHRFTVDSIAHYLLHDVEHHLWDVAQGYEALTARAEEPDGDGTSRPEGADDRGNDDW